MDRRASAAGLWCLSVVVVVMALGVLPSAMSAPAADGGMRTRRGVERVIGWGKYSARPVGGALVNGGGGGHTPYVRSYDSGISNRYGNYGSYGYNDNYNNGNYGYGRG